MKAVFSLLYDSDQSFEAFDRDLHFLVALFEYCFAVLVEVLNQRSTKGQWAGIGTVALLGLEPKDWRFSKLIWGQVLPGVLLLSCGCGFDLCGE